MAVWSGSPNNGATLVQWDCATSDNMLFEVGAVTTGPGRWDPMVQLPFIPAAGAVLSTGEVLLWSSFSKTMFGGDAGYTQTALFNPDTGVIRERLVNETRHDMFCPGISTLPDGSVMVNGGSSAGKTSIFNPITETWTSGPALNNPRAYHSSAVLADGSVMVIGGSWTGDRVFQAGPSHAMHWISTVGQGSVSRAGTRAADRFAINGNAVMYEPGRILTVGGSTAYNFGQGSSAAHIVDITGSGVNTTQTNHANLEIFTPPYLLDDNGRAVARPSITSGPRTATYGEQITVSTNTLVDEFVLVRMASATHSVNTDQRRIPVQSSGAGNSKIVSLPSEPGIALPGEYFIFAIRDGVPSVARMLRIG